MPSVVLVGDANEAKAAIEAYLAAMHVPPTHQWLQSYMPSVRLNTPLAALQKTALFRLLATDLTIAVQVGSQQCLPAGISLPEQQQLRVQGPVPVQVLDIEDIGRSRWSQVETIEMEERGEMTKGREIIRVAPDAEENSDPNPPARPALGAASAGPHKLLLQDAKGTRVFAFEMESIKGVNTSLAIGAKAVLTDFVVARGVILLEPTCFKLLGGKVDAWDKKWRDERKRLLKEKAGWTGGSD